MHTVISFVDSIRSKDDNIDNSIHEVFDLPMETLMALLHYSLQTEHQKISILILIGECFKCLPNKLLVFMVVIFQYSISQHKISLQ